MKNNQKEILKCISHNKTHWDRPNNMMKRTEGKNPWASMELPIMNKKEEIHWEKKWTEPQDLWDYNKNSKIHAIRVTEREEGKSQTKNVF